MYSNFPRLATRYGLDKLTIHYGYASKKEAQKSDDVYGQGAIGLHKA